MPSGLPAATIRPCSRWTSRTTSTVRPGSTRSIHGSVYSPVSGSSRWQPREVAEPVAQRDEAAERADRAADERLRRVAGAQQRRGEVEHRVVRADRDDRALDGVEVAQQPHLDLGAGVVALERGGDDEQPVGAHERGEHAGAARERRGDEPAADAAEPDADPVVGAERGGQPAREPRRARAGGRPARRPRARRAAGRAKMSNVSAAETG